MTQREYLQNILISIIDSEIAILQFQKSIAKEQKDKTGLNKMKERLGQADDELEKLIGTRTNAINRKLREVSSTTSLLEANDILGISTFDEND